MRYATFLAITTTLSTTSSAAVAPATDKSIDVGLAQDPNIDSPAGSITATDTQKVAEKIMQAAQDYRTVYIKRDFDVADHIIALPMSKAYSEGKDPSAKPYSLGHVVALRRDAKDASYFQDAIASPHNEALEESEKAWKVVSVRVEGLAWQPGNFRLDRVIGVTFANGTNIVYKQPRGLFRFCTDAWVRFDTPLGRNRKLSAAQKDAAPSYIKILRPPQDFDKGDANGRQMFWSKNPKLALAVGVTAGLVIAVAAGAVGGLTAVTALKSLCVATPAAKALGAGIWGVAATAGVARSTSYMGHMDHNAFMKTMDQEGYYEGLKPVIARAAEPGLAVRSVTKIVLDNKDTIDALGLVDRINEEAAENKEGLCALGFCDPKDPDAFIPECKRQPKVSGSKDKTDNDILSIIAGHTEPIEEPDAEPSPTAGTSPEIADLLKRLEGSQ